MAFPQQWGAESPRPAAANVGSPSYALLDASEKLLREFDKQSPIDSFLAKPLFTATRLARSSEGLIAQQQQQQQPFETVVVERRIHQRRSPSPQSDGSTAPSRGLGGEIPDTKTTTIFFPAKRRTVVFPALVAQAEEKLKGSDSALRGGAAATATSAATSPSLEQEDMEILAALHSAAAGLAAGQSGVRTAIRNIMTVCHQQQRDLDALTRRIAEVDSTYDDLRSRCVQSEENARTALLRVEDCATQVNSIHLEVSNALRDTKSMLLKLVQRVVKTTLLANCEAADRLHQRTVRTRLRLYFTQWERHSITKRAVLSLLQKTENGRRRTVWNVWSYQFLRRKREGRARCAVLLSNTALRMRHRAFQLWHRFRQRKIRSQHAAATIFRSTTRGLSVTYFRKWLHYTAQERSRQDLYEGLSVILYGAQRAHARRRYSNWVQYVSVAKARRRRRRVAEFLLSSNEKHFLRQCFRRWMVSTLDAANRRAAAGKLAVVNRKIFLLSYLRRWAEFRRERWVDRRIMVRVSQLQSQLDLAVVAINRAGETMSGMLERQVELEAQLLQLGATKASIRQLRAEAFRGSLIDLEHADASPQSAVRNIANHAATAVDTSRGRSVSLTQPVPVDSDSGAKSVVTTAGPPLPESLRPATVPQRAGPSGLVALPNTAPWSGNSRQAMEPNELQRQQPSVVDDPLVVLAKHYGVTTPHIKRRHLPDN